MMRSGEFVAGAILLLVIAAGLALDPEEPSSGFRTGRLTANLIEPPSPELPQIDVHTEAIPTGMTERGTSFPIGSDLWFSARHVVNTDCSHVIMVDAKQNFNASIKTLDPNADLALLQAHVPTAAPLAVANLGADQDPPDHAYAFGYPNGALGATADEYLGRTHLRLGGHIAGTAAVLAWTELDRYPGNLDSLSGISGGPMIADNGYVVGDIVAASVRRGRNYTVAPEIMVEAMKGNAVAGEMPVPDILKAPVSLPDAAKAMEQGARILETYCIPQP